ncbi:MAG: hypothetical protein LBG21_02925 [Campylobacteraceae bacterium]|jgi:hypothetical protein|nr:hypothetical protein [Campylobacteraceae bacterium]
MAQTIFDTNNTVVLINGNIISDLSSDTSITIAFPNDQMGHVVGMNGGQALKTFINGNECNIDLVLLKGSPSDDYLQTFINENSVADKVFSISITEDYYVNGAARKRFLKSEQAYIKKQADSAVNGTGTDDLSVTFNIICPNTSRSF